MSDRISESVMEQIEELDKDLDNPDSKHFHTNQFRSHVIQRLEDEKDDRRI